MAWRTGADLPGRQLPAALQRDFRGDRVVLSVPAYWPPRSLLPASSCSFSPPRLFLFCFFSAFLGGSSAAAAVCNEETAKAEPTTSTTSIFFISFSCSLGTGRHST